MKLFRIGLFQMATVGGLLAVGLSSCETNSDFEPVDTTRDSAATAEMIIPSGFLRTDYAPLTRWMDERFEVEYRNMTPELIFDQAPIADIRYDTRNLPNDAPLFHLTSNSISRREILYKVSEFWDLDMSIEAEGDTPSYVLVSGR